MSGSPQLGGSQERIAQLEQEIKRLNQQLQAAATTTTTTNTNPAPRIRHFPIPNIVGTDSYKTILYHVDEDECIAYITLNRSDRLNAIVWPMPYELRHAVEAANVDDRVRCIVLAGAGRGFCSGYDLKEFAEGERGTMAGSQVTPYDPFIDYQEMKLCTDCYMSLWHSYKPTIASVHGYAVAGGSDIALCCDMVIMTEDAKIGYPPARMWGSPTTHHWTRRIGAEQAKRMLLTGDLINGVEASRIGLILKAVPKAKLKEEVLTLTRRMKSIPQNQLFFNKFICNLVAEGGDMATTQKVATMLDGMTRHTPEGVAFQQLAHREGFQAAIQSMRNDPIEGRARFQSDLNSNNETKKQPTTSPIKGVANSKL